MVAALFLFGLFLPNWALAAAVSALSAIGCYELLKAVEKAKNPVIYIFACLTAAAIPFSAWLGYEELETRICLIVLMSVLFLLSILNYQTEKEVPLSTVTAGLFGGIIIPVCFGAIVNLHNMQNGGLLVIMTFCITAVSDSGGYFAGILFGRHKGIVKASPNKTLEGFIGSFVCGILGTLLFGVIIDMLPDINVNYGVLALLGTVGNALTQLGDLAFSVVKRQNDIKDYGNIFPGHGGVLDRFDSVIFAAPAVMLIVRYLPVFI